jgi:hypothetical protein
MNTFWEKYKRSWFVITCLAAIAGIILCNLWSLSVGNCAIHDFLKIPTIGWILIFANVAAGMALYFVKNRNKKQTDGPYCSACHTDLRDAWDYCPNCGDQVAQELHPSSIR